MATLYELTEKYRALLELAEDEYIDQDVLADTFEALDGEIEEKADGYAKVIRSLESDSEAINEEIVRLKARKSTIDTNIASMKGRLQESMKSTGKTKFKTPLFSFGIQKNPPSLCLSAETAPPNMFWVEQEPKLDKKAAIDFLKENGDQEWGSLVQSESLRIR